LSEKKNTKSDFMANKELKNAKENKKDEFYTIRDVIDAELRHYVRHFKNKTILCNCDDPYESNFFKYFAMNFEHLGLKKLIATSYGTSSVAGTQLPLFEDMPSIAPIQLTAYKIELTGVTGIYTLDDVRMLVKQNVKRLNGNGDFRSDECVKLLKQADIVVTNPPFSKFREYVTQLIEHEKQFLIIGSKNAITYREIFKLIKENKLWLGNEFPNGNAYFKIPEAYAREWASGVYDPKTGLVKFRNVGWFTNLDVAKRHEELLLYREYEADTYKTYENYNAINVDKVVEIPKNFNGVIGVPITFLDKHNPDQFNIIGLGISNSGIEVGVRPYKPEHKKYRKEVQKRGAVDGDLYMMIDDVVTVPYARVLIKRKGATQ
jgi:hypothetical protein